MPAHDKAALISVTDAEFAKLEPLLDRVPVERWSEPDNDQTSIKDVVAHRAHWIDLFLGWYRDGCAGLDVQFPAPGYKWNELKRYNADLRQHQAHLSWDEARTLLEGRHDALRQLISGLTDADLYGSPMQGANNTWTTGRWAEAAGASHYRSAAKYIRARLRQMA